MATNYRPSRLGIDRAVRDEIEARSSAGMSAPEIHRVLKQSQTSESSVPTLRTIQRIVADMAPRDTSGLWTAEHAQERPRPILDTLVAVIEQTHGRVTALTREEARWIARLDTVAPDVRPFEWWRIARLYLGRINRSERTHDLDAFLAFAPWRGGEAGRRRYDNALRAGWIQPVPSFLRRAIEEGEVADSVPGRPATVDKQSRTHRATTP